MAARIQQTTPDPNLTTGVQHLFKAINAAGVPQQTLELVHLRASQINGCSYCVNAGSRSAAQKGMSTEKLLAVAAWYESELFDDAERAALTLTEAATRLADRPGAVTDEIWDEAAKHYDERQLAALVLMVGSATSSTASIPPCGSRPARPGTDPLTEDRSPGLPAPRAGLRRRRRRGPAAGASRFAAAPRPVA